jgi:signal transduction histidine kinase
MHAANRTALSPEADELAPPSPLDEPPQPASKPTSSRAIVASHLSNRHRRGLTCAPPPRSLDVRREALYDAAGNTLGTCAVNSLLQRVGHAGHVVKARLVALANRPHLPPRTVRLRLTLLYSALFVVSSAVLLGITYLLVRHSIGGSFMVFRVGPRGLLPPETALSEAQRLDLHEAARRLQETALQQRDDLVEQLLIQSGIALAIMSVASIALGWVVAGRALRPLRTMASTAQRISHDNLHERLALDGPDDELKRLADTIDDLLARLEGAFEAQRRFVANASHELRTPLAMMRTSLDVATTKPGPIPLQVTALDVKLREGLDQADRLLEGFLALSRAQHGELSDQAAVSLAALAAAAVEARNDEIAAQRLEVRIGAGNAHVRGSETLLAQLVANLVDNAVRHNVADGWLSVATRADADVATLVVESSGPRLDACRVQELTQPFRRLGVDRTRSERGAGLGLSIVAAIASAHGGRVALDAREEGGLRVTVRLPLALPAPSAAAERSLTGAEAQIAGASRAR